MSFTEIDALPDLPDADAIGDDFNIPAILFFQALAAWRAQINALSGEFADYLTAAFTATSATNLAIGTGNKVATVGAGKMYAAGQLVMMASAAAPQTNFMRGTVVSYAAGDLTVNVPVGGTGGAGNHADWVISPIPSTNALALTGGTMTGLLTLAADIGLVLTPGNDPAGAVNGQLWAKAAALMAKIGGTNYQVVLDTLAQTLSSKTLIGPTITDYLETVSAPAAGSAFTVNLANGTLIYLQTNANATITLPTPAAGKSFLAGVKYGGAHTLGWAGGTVKWPQGVTPTPTSVNGKFDLFGGVCLDGASWLGWQAGANF